jgi:hypothetical protein
MTDTGSPIERFGTLIRKDAGFALRSDGGTVFHLQLHRVPVDHVEKRVRVTGVLIEDDLIEAEGVAPA